MQRKRAGWVPMYDFKTKSEMLRSGVLEKGDIIWIWNENEGGNQISPITGLSNNVSYTVMKL
mgnify:FL=1